MKVEMAPAIVRGVVLGEQEVLDGLAQIALLFFNEGFTFKGEIALGPGLQGLVILLLQRIELAVLASLQHAVGLCLETVGADSLQG